MSSSMIEFILLAGIAAFVGWRLFVTLGQDEGPPEGRSRVPTPAPAPNQDNDAPSGGDVVPMRPSFTGPGAAGLEAIFEADSSFDPRTFMQGARSAYEMIVAAFARGDRDALKPLLDTDVYEAWDTAIAERETTGAEGMQLLRVRKAEISDASLAADGMARVTVHYESELGDGESTVKASELWTFMRQTSSDDPNWILDDVDTAD
ncbi:MAG: Tim44/TimA family putative adaptor protein [Pseudomonadota bacterium]